MALGVVHIGLIKMQAYWYLTRAKQKPKNRKLISATARKDCVILEFACEVDCDKLKECKFHYLGYGEFSDYEIQVALLKTLKKHN